MFSVVLKFVPGMKNTSTFFLAMHSWIW
uniref:Uncharacterized protein n=1 Tax=Moniliophthora roreri TaxID=221103 RepID=A0A0W0G1Y0_MONRR